MLGTDSERLDVLGERGGMNRRGVVAAAIAGSITLPLPQVAKRPVGATGETGAFIDMPTYVQQRNLSCEYAALTIATGAFGAWVSEF